MHCLKIFGPNPTSLIVVKICSADNSSVTLSMDVSKMLQSVRMIPRQQHLVAIVISIILLSNSYSSAVNPDATNLQKLSRAHLEFALSLFRELASDSNPTDNVVISPHR